MNSTCSVIGAFLVFILLLYLVTNTNERHYYVNGQLFKALHIALPGFATIYYPEQEVDLQKWVGTKYNGLKAFNTIDKTENPEATAGLALKMAGIYSDYELKNKNGHYILYRPQKTEQFFTMKDWYRIWSGKKVKK